VPGKKKARHEGRAWKVWERMPERQFAFAADSDFVQVRKTPIWMQSLQLKAEFGLISPKFCKISA
jgi:hypothetical protein